MTVNIILISFIMCLKNPSWTVWLLFGPCPAKWKVTRLITGQGTCLGCGYGPRLEDIREATDCYFSPSLSSSPPRSLKKKKKEKEKERKEKKGKEKRKKSLPSTVLSTSPKWIHLVLKTMMREILLSFPFHIWKNWGREIINFSKVTKLVSVKPRLDPSSLILESVLGRLSM